MIDPYCQTKFYVSQIDNVETVDCMHYDFNLPNHLAMTCQIKNKYHTYGDFHLSWSFSFMIELSETCLQKPEMNTLV